jgi:hypothetical protein
VHRERRQDRHQGLERRHPRDRRRHDSGVMSNSNDCESRRVTIGGFFRFAIPAT